MLFTHSVNGSTAKYMDMTNMEENKFTSSNCHIVDDPSSVHVLKSSPNPTLSQLTTASCHIELEDGHSIIKSEDSSFAMPFMH